MREDCSYFRELVTTVDWLDEAEHRTLAEHVAQCARCRADLTLVNEIGLALAPEALPAPPADLTDRIMAGIRQETAPRRSAPIAVMLLGVLALQLLALYSLSESSAETVAEAEALMLGVWREFVQPAGTTVLTSLLEWGRIPDLSRAVEWGSLSLPRVVGLLLLCLGASAVLFCYPEERKHG